jgi:hypothetical protein
VFDWIEKFVTDFSWKRLVLLFLLILLVTAAFIIYESLTSSFQLAKYERTVQLLIDLEKLSETDDDVVEGIKDNISYGLYQTTSQVNIGMVLEAPNARRILQALVAASIWIIVVLATIPGTLRGEKKSRDLMLGCGVIGILVAVGAILIPPTWPRWFGFGLYPVLINVVILGVAYYYGSRDK